MRKRWAIRIGALVLSIGGVAIVVHGLEDWRVRGERSARARDDGALHRRALGEGPLVLFLPGLLGTSRYWEGTFDELAADHRIAYVDPLGFGWSPWPEIEYTLEEHVAALDATVEQESAGAGVILVGHSFGALLAAYYGARHPERVEKVVLLGLPIFESEEDGRRRIGELGALARAFALNETIAMASCHVLCAFRPAFARRMPYVVQRHPPEVVADGVLHWWGSYRGTLENVLLSQFAQEPVRALRERAVLVHAEADEITPIERARALASEAGAALIVVSGDHDDYLEHREVILEAIRGRHRLETAGRHP